MGLILGGLLLSKIPKFSRQFLSIKCLLFEKFHFLGNFFRRNVQTDTKETRNT